MTNAHHESVRRDESQDEFMPAALEATRDGAVFSPGDKRGSRSDSERGIHAITYHSVARVRSSSTYAVTIDQLAEHLDLISQISRGKGDVRQLTTVTFDDGHVSNFKYALPVLQDHSVRAIFFVVASFVGSKPECMTWEQLREMADLGHEIQSHTWSHPLLTHCSDAELQNELLDSKRAIECHLGRPVEALSVPGGRWNRRVLRAAANAGYRRFYVSDPWISSKQFGECGLFGRLTVKASIQPEQLQSLLAGQGINRFFYRGGYKAKEFIRKTVGDFAYRRIWALISNAGQHDDVFER